jgi:uncharacterized protein YcbK (DUF882 family)
MVTLRNLTAALVVLGTLVLAAPASAQREHVVRSGQTMAVIARRYHVDVWDLALASGLRPTATLRVGQTLTVPSANTTYVRPGQTLSEIARAHDCDIAELRRLNRLRERSTLRVGMRLVLPGFEATESAGPHEYGPPEEPGVVSLRRRDETRRATLLDDERRVTADGVTALAELMRRHDEDTAELPHPRLVALLAAISDHFGGAEITIVSGRREAGGYTRESSRHTRGQATDIRVRGVAMRSVWDYCRTLPNTGCGFYPRSSFVHVDVRGTAAQWVDWSSPGRAARYGNLERAWPRMCRRHDRRTHRHCRREGRRVTAPDDLAIAALMTSDAVALYPAIPIEDEDDGEVDEYDTAIDDEEVALGGEPIDPEEDGVHVGSAAPARRYSWRLLGVPESASLAPIPEAPTE